MRRDREKLSVSAAALLGVAVVGLLVLENVVVSLSITGRAALLAGLLLFLATLAAGFRPVPMLGILVIGAAVATGLFSALAAGYGARLGIPAAFLLAAVASLFIYLVQDGQWWLARPKARALLAVLLVGSVLVVGVDIRYGEVTYEVALDDEVRVPSEEPTVTAGTATATNSFILRERAQFPELRPCLYTDDGVSELGWLYRDGSSTLFRSVPGEGTLTTRVQLFFSEAQREAAPERLPVERAASCPDERDEPGIVVVVDDPGADL